MHAVHTFTVIGSRDLYEMTLNENTPESSFRRFIGDTNIGGYEQIGDLRIKITIIIENAIFSEK